MQQIKLNRNYKDRLFRLAFQEKKDLLDLYNAVSGRQYTNPDDLIITTLADAIYLGMKNDISFLVSDVLNLYEHQSSFNPNMPVRGLNYFADTYREYIDRNGFDIYGEKLIRLPMPQYIVFYNGTKEEPDRIELRLSDAFLCQNPEEKGCLECRATMININHGRSAFEAALFLRILTQKCIRKPKFDPIRFLFRPIVKDDILRHRQTDQLFSIDVKSVSVNVFPVSVCKIIQTANRHIRIKAALMLI